MEINKTSIEQQFDDIARHYDEQRKKLIPCFDDFYNIAASLAEWGNDTPNVLDLGAGTGLFSSYIAKKYPKASFTLIDLSSGMLDIARRRFQNINNVQFFAENYYKFEYTQKYDLVISSLSIHHLSDAEKKELYQRIYYIMNDNGIFINADQVLGHTHFLESLYKSDWNNYIEHSGLAADAIEAARKRTTLDKMSTLEQQLGWLNASGFVDVDCIYKYYNFVVLYARKV